MTKDLIWILPALTGYFAALFFKPKMALIVVAALAALALVSVSFTSQNAGTVIAMILSFFAPIILGNALVGALAGAGVRRLSQNNRAHVGAIVTFFLLAAIAVYLFQGDKQDRSLVDEEALALAFVKGHSDVIAAAGLQSRISVASKVFRQSNLPSRYDISVVGNETVFAIVDVTRASGRPTFTLACVTNLSMGARESHKDVCSTKK